MPKFRTHEKWLGTATFTLNEPVFPSKVTRRNVGFAVNRLIHRVRQTSVPFYFEWFSCSTLSL